MADAFRQGKAYAEGGNWQAPADYEAVRVDEAPVAGFYRRRMVRGGPLVGVRIWYGPPHDPVTGEEMDRGWRWQAEMNGEPIDIARVEFVWREERIDEIEYRYLSDMQAWAKRNEPQSPAANPFSPINVNAAPLAL